MFISPPINGMIYIAEHSRKGARRLLWSVMPVISIAADVRVDVREVPQRIRVKAYKSMWYRKQRVTER